MARETAADVAEALHGAAQPLVADVVGRVSFMVLAALMVPVGILVLIATFVAFAFLATVLQPTGLVAGALTIGWLLVTLAALFLVFRAMYRRMPRRLRAAYSDGVEGPSAPAVTVARSPVAAPAAAPAPTSLAELDARLAPPAGPPEVPRR